MRIMNFNYGFDFDLDDFVEYVEDDYFDDEVEYNEEADKEWLKSRLYDYVGDDIDIPSLLVIRSDLKCCGGKEIYVQQIVDKAYEILENKRVGLKKEEERKELNKHLQAIEDYCNKGENCFGCPMGAACTSMQLVLEAWKYSNR